jgi:hypothetical protein
MIWSSDFHLLQYSLTCFLLRNPTLQCQIAPSNLVKMLAFDLCRVILVRRREIVLKEPHPLLQEMLRDDDLHAVPIKGNNRRGDIGIESRGPLLETGNPLLIDGLVELQGEGTVSVVFLPDQARITALKSKACGSILIPHRRGWYQFKENIIRGYVRLRAEEQGVELATEYAAASASGSQSVWKQSSRRRRFGTRREDMRRTQYHDIEETPRRD